MGDLITVIIPVYNTAQYLDNCLNSVCKQTYENLEIILVNDGSTDQSGEICEKWSKLDERIVYIYQHNQGQGMARNVAIDIARGVYLVFVDSDDWLEKEAIEILYKRITEEEADICLTTSFYQYDDSCKITKNVVCEPTKDIDDFANYKFPGLCWKLFRKDLFIKNGIKMPNVPYEDTAIYPALIFNAKKISYNDKPIYYYRVNTGKSTTDNSKNIVRFTETLEYLIELLKREQLYDSHKELIAELAINFMTILQGRAKAEMEYGDFIKVKERFSAFIDKEYPEYAELYKEKKFWMVGSYNLKKIVDRMLYATEHSSIEDKSNYYFGSSSIISLMCGGKTERTEHCTNETQENTMSEDFQKSFLEISCNKDDYICIDFLEERFDILKYNKRFITKSETIAETKRITDANLIVIKNGSEEYEKLWEYFCIKFVEYLKEKFKRNHIILFRNYLTPYKNFEGSPYTWDNTDKNEALKRKYDFFLDLLPGVKVIDIPQEVYFTDGNSKYGEGAFYLNDLAHQKMAKLALREICKNSKTFSKKNRPKVTIAIPVYNGSNYLAEAIECALAQTYSNIEIIVVNDGSNDNGATEKIAMSYGNKIKYLRKENGGVASALNVAIQNMEGEYFSWLSHDDLYDFDKIEKQVNAIEMTGNPMTIVYSNYIIWDISRGLTYDTKMETRYSWEQLTESLYPVFMGLINGCTILFHKKHFERVGLFNEQLKTTQDYEFWFRLFRHQKVSFIVDNLVTERCHDAQGSRTITGYENERNNLYFNFMNQISKQEIEELFGGEYYFYLKLISMFKQWKLPLCVEEATKRFKNSEEPLDYAVKFVELRQYIDDLFGKNGIGLYIFGAGKIGRRLLNQLKMRNIEIDGIIDNSEEKQGELIDGVFCYKLATVKKEKRIIVAVKNNEAIIRQLREEGYLNVSTNYLGLLRTIEKVPVSKEFFLEESGII